MKDRLFESIKVSSYFLWEYTKSDNALQLWCCSEDLACFFQRNGITSSAILDDILNKGKHNPMYVDFVRNISYRIFMYTGNTDHTQNWFLAEKLLTNAEWKNAMVTASNIFKDIDKELCKTIRAESIRNYYYDNQF